MTFEDIKEKNQKYLFQNYGRQDICFAYGEGSYLTDVNGKQYLDMVAGIAVNSVGHSHPYWVEAVAQQAARLVHTSNLYQVEKQVELAEKIASVTPKGMSKTLFVNSGAEANEAALKIAVRKTGRSKVISALNSFHGRTAGALGATGQTKYQDTFQPLISGNYGYFEFGNLESLKEKMCKDTAAVILEPIQGEGGVQTASKEFFKGVRDICTDNETLMIMDEVQTGIARTGKWFGIQHYDVIPDIMTLAKGLGGGVPIGAAVTTDDIAKTLTPGTHGTTFGGNPLVCAAGSAVIDIIKQEKLVENAKKLGDELMEGLKSVKNPEIIDVRGKGLLIGVEIKSKAKEFQEFALKCGMLVNICHGNVLRLMPPLNITEDDTEMFMHLFRKFFR
jgi:acetylornithine and succinylornithine aminotransferases